MNNDIQKTLGEILGTLKSFESRIAAIENGIPSRKAELPLASVTKKTSIKEFLIEKKPKGGVQTTLAIAYYVEIMDGITPLNRADLEKGFRVAKESVPDNINDKVNMSIKSGYMMEADSKKDSMKAWVLTSSGERYVHAGFGSKKN